MKKFKLNWQSVALGVVLCAVLVVFIGSKAADPQVVTGASVQKARVTQQTANTADVYDKTVTLEEKLTAIEKHLTRIEKKIDDTYKEVHRIMLINKK